MFKEISRESYIRLYYGFVLTLILKMYLLNNVEQLKKF